MMFKDLPADGKSYDELSSEERDATDRVGNFILFWGFIAITALAGIAEIAVTIYAKMSAS